jgi:plasmid stabilization system protein ParE
MSSNPQYKVILSVRARRMLAEHIHFLAQFNPGAVKDTKQRILDAARSLRDFPERHPYYANEFYPNSDYRKMFVKNWYIIFYKVVGKIVYADYIVDCRQDYAWLIR